MTEKKRKKIYDFEAIVFENILLLSISKFSFQTPSSDDILAGNYMVNFNYFIGRPNKVKESFQIFLIDHYTVDIGNKHISGP